MSFRPTITVLFLVAFSGAFAPPQERAKSFHSRGVPLFACGDGEASDTSRGPGVHKADDLRAQRDARNRARAKFGLPPLGPGEFAALQAQVRALEREQRGRREALAEDREALAEDQRRRSAGPVRSFVEGMLRDTCRSNFDCDRPKVCCDLRFRKVCCSSGNTRRDVEGELALIPVAQRG